MSGIKYSLVVALILLAASVAAAAPSPAGYHIAIVTGSMARSPDAYAGAVVLARALGSADSGGIVNHLASPDELTDQEAWLSSRLLALGSDPLLKAIVVNGHVVGLSTVLKRVRAARPDVLLFAAESWDDPLALQGAADLAVNCDNVSRAYFLAWTAKRLGARTFVQVSFARHRANQYFAARTRVMEAACADLGLAFESVTVPDPRSGSGLEAGIKALKAGMSVWEERYGKDTAYFCTEDAYAETLIALVLANGGIYPEGNLPSPSTGFPGAFGLSAGADPGMAAGGYPALLKKLDAAVVAKGAAGRFGTWTFPAAYAFSAGLGEFAREILEGNAKKDSLKDLLSALGKYTPGVSWSGDNYRDSGTQARARNQVMVFADTYVFGRGYLGTQKLQFPEKYLRLAAKD